MKEDRCWCRRLGSSLFIRDCAATKISAATTGWRLGFPWSCPGRLCLGCPWSSGDLCRPGVVRSRRRRWQVPIADGMRAFLPSCTANGAAMRRRRRRWRRCRTRHGLLSRSPCDLSSGSLTELSAVGGLLRCGSLLSAERAHLDAASVRPGVDRFNCRFWPEPGDVD